MDMRISDDLLGMTREEIEKEKAKTHPTERLKGFYRDKDKQKQEDKKLLEDAMTKTVEGAALKEKQDKRIGFNVEKNINPVQRLKFIHEFNKEAAELVELYKKGKLTPLP